MSIFVDAIKNLIPNSSWACAGEEVYENIDWQDSVNPKPSKQAVEAEITRLQIAIGHVEPRSKEYPPITDYLDGVVKGDQVQIDKYIADCLAVKAKYPKGVA